MIKSITTSIKNPKIIKKTQIVAVGVMIFCIGKKIGKNISMMRPKIFNKVKELAYLSYFHAVTAYPILKEENIAAPIP